MSIDLFNPLLFIDLTYTNLSTLDGTVVGIGKTTGDGTIDGDGIIDGIGAMENGVGGGADIRIAIFITIGDFSLETFTVTIG